MFLEINEIPFKIFYSKVSFLTVEIATFEQVQYYAINLMNKSFSKLLYFQALCYKY